MDTKRLRHKILDLAIHGKLVPQNPDDEPACKLLERIHKEESQHIKESQKSVFSHKPIHNDVPFDIPEGWTFIKGKDLFKPMRSVKPAIDTFKYIDIDSIDNKKGVVTEVKVVPTSNAPSRATRYTEKGNVLFSMVRPYLRNIAKVPEDGCIASTGFYVCYPNDMMIPDFCYYLMMSAYVVEGLNQFMKGDNSPSINTYNINEWLYPVPPVNEQIRIVSKIDELMSTIDDMDSCLNILAKTISFSKTKILDLVIHGKLVPQDVNDEPAAVLLNRLGISSINNHHEDAPFAIPEGWCWSTLGEIGKWQAGGTPNRLHKEYYGGDIPWLKTGDLNDDFITDIPEHITQAGLDNSSAKLNPADSVLIAMYGATIGKLGILTFPATTNQACCACIQYKAVTRDYLFHFLMSHKDEFIRQGGGGAQPNISKDIILKTLIPVPPMKEQIRIVEKIKELQAQLEQIQNQL